jgi:tRNA-dihydrouridine synthase B
MTPSFTYEFAPLEDTSDVALRELCWRHGADVTYTEMARVESLARNNKSTFEKTRMDGKAPAWIQITPGKDQVLKRYLTAFSKRNEVPQTFLGFNFNMGCPSPHLIRDGLGCAMVKRVSKTQKMVSIVKDYGFPVSIKIRLGLNKLEKERKVYRNLIDAVDIDKFIVHGRVGSDTYAVPADYDAIAECASLGKTVIANGDIHTLQQVEQLKAAGCAGVMIGRAAVFDPAIFDRLKGKATETKPTMAELLAEYYELCARYPSAPKYRKNVEKRLGRPVTTIAQLWNDAEDNESVMG